MADRRGHRVVPELVPKKVQIFWPRTCGIFPSIHFSLFLYPSFFLSNSFFIFLRYNIITKKVKERI